MVLGDAKTGIASGSEEEVHHPQSHYVSTCYICENDNRVVFNYKTTVLYAEAFNSIREPEGVYQLTFQHCIRGSSRAVKGSRL